MTETKDSETADFLKKKIKLKKDDVEVVELQESLKSLYFKKRQRDYPNDDPPLQNETFDVSHPYWLRSCPRNRQHIPLNDDIFKNEKLYKYPEDGKKSKEANRSNSVKTSPAIR